jgi:hypothetical protein
MMRRTAVLTSVIGMSMVALLGLTGCSSLADVPPASASVSEVAKTYLEAAKSGDCKMTRALTQDRTFAWCDNPKLLSYKILGKPVSYPAMQGAPATVAVNTSLVSKGTDKAENFNGVKPWTFYFVRETSGWRLYDQGQG